jgi:sodium/bile acid cotransporter 7
MAKVLFAPSALGMIILPLMLFHQIQLMVCAVMAQKWAQREAEPAKAAETSADLSR